ncbi:forkhead box protein N4 [Bombina bombina]|uniref:forkhead box protein N4 n=1 Tax=Bombina bombina TaxID=8345 RepID=UPI00235A8EE4|nr:forkhead box protein N4 [Bombina bombina]
MIDSDLSTLMSGIIRNTGQNHDPQSQEYRLMTSDTPQMREDDLPNDLQSLSWLTSVDVPRLQQMTSGRIEYSLISQNAMLQQQGHMQSHGTMIHQPTTMQQDIMGLNTMTSHGCNISQYNMGGHLPQQPMYQPHSQQVFTLSQGSQQCSAGLYNNSYRTQSQYSQTHLATHPTQDLHPKSFPKPIYSYSCLIAMALKNSKNGSLPVSEIYSFMKEHFPYFKTAPDGWKNSVRHNLSLNKCFEKVENKLSGSSRKGCLWALNPAKIDKMEEEMQKWKRKDLPAIRRSMANPDELDKLIMDRPENCKALSKKTESELSVMTDIVNVSGRIPVSQLQPHTVMTLSLQSIPLHHQIQTQARIATCSPAPAQSPPLHTIPDMTHSPQHQHIMNRAASDFLSLTTDMSTEVDALDPSIMDFALQGNIWEEMKEESFSLDTLGAFSNSPLQLSDCDLGTIGLTPVSSSSDHSFSDFQVTSLYTTYATLDSVPSSQCVTGQGNKPIALL